MDKFLHEIDDASTGLFYMSEGDYPLDVIFIDNPAISHLDEITLLELFKEPMDAPVQSETLRHFFRNMVKIGPHASPEEKEIALRFKHLLQLLEENLEDIKVYKVGEVEINAYIIGKTATGDFAGLKTTVIET